MHKEKTLIHLLNTALLLFVGALYVILPQSASILTFIIFTGLLTLLLIVPRLRKITFFARFDRFLLAIARNSKWTGIWTTLWFLLHFSTALLGGQLSQAASVLGGLMLAIFMTLLLLSNQWSYAHVKWWKRLNMLVWSVPSLGLAYSLHLPANRAIAIIYVSMILAGLSGIFVPKPDYFARIRLGLLAGGLALGVAVAVYF